MTAVPQPPAAELLDQLAQQEHHGASAEGCTVCRLVTALRAVLADLDDLALAPDPADRSIARMLRGNLAAALTDGTPR